MNKKLKLEELGRVAIDEYKAQKKQSLVVVLDNIRSAYNIGSVFRTADAMAVEKIVLCGITAKPPNREIFKTALGASESVEWEYEIDSVAAVKFLKGKGYKIISLEQVERSVSLENFQPLPAEKYVLVLGNEVDGVQQEVIDVSEICIEIPQFGTKHSLNVAVSAGIALWDITGKIKRAFISPSK